MAASVCYAFENTGAQFPQAQFSSVNTYSMASGHTVNITPVGATTAYSESTATQPYRPVGPRRVGEHPNDPYPTPVGDAPIPLILLFVMLYLIITYKKKAATD